MSYRRRNVFLVWKPYAQRTDLSESTIVRMANDAESAKTPKEPNLQYLYCYAKNAYKLIFLPRIFGMKPFIILGLLIIFPLLHSCGMFGGAEPEITKEEPTVTDSSG